MITTLTFDFSTVRWVATSTLSFLRSGRFLKNLCRVTSIELSPRRDENIRHPDSNEALKLPPSVQMATERYLFPFNYSKKSTFCSVGKKSRNNEKVVR